MPCLATGAPSISVESATSSTLSATAQEAPAVRGVYMPRTANRITKLLSSAAIASDHILSLIPNVLLHGLFGKIAEYSTPFSTAAEELRAPGLQAWGRSR